MKKKAWILTIFILFLIMIKCDVFEPEKKTGSLQIVLVKDENGLQKSTANLSSVQCILHKGSNEIYNDYLTLRASSFYAEVKDLEPSNDYKVLLYGRNSDNDILARGYETGVSVRAGEQTTVNMRWSSFFPVLNSPANGSTVNSVAVTFDWKDVEGAVNYHLMVAISNKFNVPLINKDTITVSYYTFPNDLQEADVLNRDYYWKVRSKDSQGNWGAWSNTWRFTVSTASTTIEWVTKVVSIFMALTTITLCPFLT